MDVACSEREPAYCEIKNLDREEPDLDRDMPVACDEKWNLEREMEVACVEKGLTYREIKNLEKEKSDLDREIPMACDEKEVACSEKRLAYGE